MHINFSLVLSGFIFFLFFSVFSNVNAQNVNDSSFHYSIDIQGLYSGKKAKPFWLVSNKYGIYEGNKNEALLLGEISKTFLLKKINLETGAKFNIKSELDQSYLQELFINVNYGALKLILGKEELTFSQYSDDLSSGSFYLSSNARPIPRVGIGFYDYTDVPFTKGYVQFKAFVNQGFLNDNRDSLGTDFPLFHEKILYLKTNKLPINPHIGLNHSALFGGTLPDGRKIPVDYLAVFFGKGSKKVGDDFSGELSNAAGAHSGLFDIGFNTSINNVDFTGYFQKPFSDKSGVNHFFKYNHDYIFGLVLKWNEKQFIEEVLFECINTLYQGGEGLTDPKIGGKMYYPGEEIINKDQIMEEVYGIEVDNISDEDFWRFVRREENYGWQYGGRDNYYNNSMYYMGWSYFQNSIGNPLLLSIKRILEINSDFDISYDLYFANTRIRAHHLGMRGSIGKNLSYRTIFTFTYNYGTYRGWNRGRNEWDSKNPYSDYDYFFEYGLAQYYTALDLHYTLPKNNNLVLNLSLGADFGEMYNSFGCIAGITYNGIIPTRKKSSD